MTETTYPKPGISVRRTGHVVFEYQCMSVEVPLAEIKHCVRAAPVILQGVLQF